jgi:hypothetical protein
MQFFGDNDAGADLCFPGLVDMLGDVTLEVAQEVGVDVGVEWVFNTLLAFEEVCGLTSLVWPPAPSR